MTFGGFALRWTSVTCAVLLAAGVTACGADATRGDSAPPYDQNALAARAAAPCIPAGPAPAFRVLGTGTDTTLLLATPHDAPPFAAFAQFGRPGGAPAVGGRLTPAEAPVTGTPAGSDAYAATIPALPPGAYDVTLQVVQYTNLAPECQKSFSIALGSVTLR